MSRTSDNPEPSAPSSNYLAFIEGALKNMADLTVIANTMPIGPAREIYRTYSAFDNIAEMLSENVLDLSNTLLEMQGIHLKLTKQTCTEYKESHTLVYCNDLILDRVETILDSMDTYRKN